jgi:mevalonate kinase
MRTITASAPGKFIILGEHAVVYGKPAVALAIDRRFSCTVRLSKDLRLNGRTSDSEAHPHVRTIIQRNGCGPIAVDTESTIPSGSGLGSSAALSASLSMAVRTLCGNPTDEESVANDAFEAEWAAQGRASPMDTSVSTHGGGVALNAGGNHLWTISKDERTWEVSEAEIPEMTFVVGYTGIKAPTGPLVEKVRKYRSKNRFASDMVDEIGRITVDGMDALRRKDVEELGALMTEDHKLLSILGVSCTELNVLVNSALRYSYGAKLTGSGGGGCMIALTDTPDKVCETLRMHGGIPFVVKTGEAGVRIDNMF